MAYVHPLVASLLHYIRLHVIANLVLNDVGDIVHIHIIFAINRGGGNGSPSRGGICRLRLHGLLLSLLDKTLGVIRGEKPSLHQKIDQVECDIGRGRNGIAPRRRLEIRPQVRVERRRAMALLGPLSITAAPITRKAPITPKLPR